MKQVPDSVNAVRSALKEPTNPTTSFRTRKLTKDCTLYIFNRRSISARLIMGVTLINRFLENLTKRPSKCTKNICKPSRKGNEMSRLTMKVTTEVTDDQGNKTVDNILSLGQMKLIDVVKMQIEQVKAVLARLESQLAELQGQGQV